MAGAGSREDVRNYCYFGYICGRCFVGKKHAGEIASLALDLLDGIQSFEIPHMRTEKLQLRIGLHTGRYNLIEF